MGSKILYKSGFYNNGNGGGGGSSGVDVSEYFVKADDAVVINAYKIDNLLHIHFCWDYNLHLSTPVGDNVELSTFDNAPFKFKYKFQQTATGCYDNNKMPSDRIAYIGNWGTSDNSFYTNKLVMKSSSSVRFWYCDFIVEVVDA